MGCLALRSAAAKEGLYLLFCKSLAFAISLWLLSYFLAGFGKFGT